ncbi:MAG: DegT/DnrJ/EryC1/StrS family aminotransferase [Gemmatimonadota bacterium]
MIARRQLPVSSTITGRSLVQALGLALRDGAQERAALASELCTAFHASGAVLVDSGTSALAMALRSTTPAGKVVALPAYACVDIGAAAIHARLRVRLYDIDPATLSPDLDSVSRVLAAGVDAIVVSHLYGYPADVPGVAALAAAHGTTVIEDAAQSAWGSLLGTRLGSFGPLSVLSFGRGKGLGGGGGGALLSVGRAGVDALANAGSRVAASSGALRTLVVATAQWALGRPALYALPSAIPALHLGETIYHPAHEPIEITPVSASLVRAALKRADRDLAVRRGNALELERAIGRSRDVSAIRALVNGKTGYLRFPVRLAPTRTTKKDEAALGIVHGYPNTLAELPELQPLIIGDEALQGSRELQRSLVTLPTHALVTKEDLKNLSSWMG